MATPAKKAKTDPTPTDQRPCPYGSRCYRKNPKHFEEYSHPDADSTDTTTSTSTDHAFFDSTGLPPCKYGAKCYRKNLLHFAEFSHPTQGPTTDPSFPADDSEGDTEVYDSDDEDVSTTALSVVFVVHVPMKHVTYVQTLRAVTCIFTLSSLLNF